MAEREDYRYPFESILKSEMTLEKENGDVIRRGGIARGFDVSRNGDIPYEKMADKFGNSALKVQKSDYSKILAEVELDMVNKHYVNKNYEYLH